MFKDRKQASSARMSQILQPLARNSKLMFESLTNGWSEVAHIFEVKIPTPKAGVGDTRIFGPDSETNTDSRDRRDSIPIPILTISGRFRDQLDSGSCW